MSFWLSKVLWIVAAPSNALLILLTVGFLLIVVGRRRLGGWLVGGAVVAFLAIAILPTGLLMVPLENRFPQVTEAPREVDGIIVLGGSFGLRGSESRDQIQLNGNAERLTTFVTLARTYPKARLIFTGGSGSLDPGLLREADLARRLFSDLGLDVRRIEFERESRNTYENALYSYRLAKPKADEKWLLVTSAFHMPRAMGVFRKVGWEPEPYPVDYMTEKDAGFTLGFSFAGGISTLDYATHEWLGLAAYYALGRTSSLFPGPGRGETGG